MFCRWNNRAHVQRNSGRYDKRCTPRRGCYRSAAWEEEPDVTSFWLPKRGWGALNRKQSFWNCLKSGLGAPGKNSEWLAGPSAINVSFPALESSTAAAAVRARVGALGGVTSSDSGSGRPERALPGVTVPSRSLHCSLHTHTHTTSAGSWDQGWTTQERYLSVSPTSSSCHTMRGTSNRKKFF